MAKLRTIKLKCEVSYIDRFKGGKVYEAWVDTHNRTVYTRNDLGDVESLFNSDTGMDTSWFPRHFEIPRGWTMKLITEFLCGGEKPVTDYEDDYDRAMSIL